MMSFVDEDVFVSLGYSSSSRWRCDGSGFALNPRAVRSSERVASLRPQTEIQSPVVLLPSVNGTKLADDEGLGTSTTSSAQSRRLPSEPAAGPSTDPSSILTVKYHRPIRTTERNCATEIARVTQLRKGERMSAKHKPPIASTTGDGLKTLVVKSAFTATASPPRPPEKPLQRRTGRRTAPPVPPTQRRR